MELHKVFSILLYGLSSFGITVVNKIVLTSYGFPSYAFLGLAQMVSIVLLLAVLHLFGKVRIISLTQETFWRIMPLPILYLINLFFGLGSTKGLSLPMFVVLRRFTMLITVILEYVILKHKSSNPVLLSVFIMIFGSLIAAMNDLGFDAVVYTVVMVNNLATASNNVVSKMKLVNKDIDKQSLVYYNCLFGIFPLFLWCSLFEDMALIYDYDRWLDTSFMLAFLFSCSSAYLLLISVAWCVEANGPLMPAIVGTMKNSVISYLGMFIGGDYIFNWPNFIGVTISMIGAVFYTLVTTFWKSPAAVKAQTANSLETAPKTSTV